MQTIASLANKLDMTAEQALEKLKFMYFEVESVNTEIDDETCDLLIDVDDDDSVADRVRAQRLADMEKKKKRIENLQKANAKRKSAKPAPKKKAAAKKTADSEEPAPAEVETAEAPAAEPPAVEEPKEAPVHKDSIFETPVHAVAEILPAHVYEEEAPAEDGETAPAAAVEPQAPKKPAEPAAPAMHTPLADAERAARNKAAERPAPRVITKLAPPQGATPSMITPDPAVVAEVKRRHAERMAAQQQTQGRRGGGAPATPDAGASPEDLALLGPGRSEGRRSGGGGRGPTGAQGDTGLKATGKTAKKKQKRAERARQVEIRERDAAAAVREYEAGGDFGFGPRRRKKRRQREDGTFMDAEGPSQPEFIEVEGSLTVEELAGMTGFGVNDIILELMNFNIMATKNQPLPIDLVRQLVEPKGVEVRSVIPEETEILFEEADDPAELIPRSPVITVMGHVDHGKTSFLDYIRRAKVAEGEAGGITQHIAAYDVTVGERRVVFLDTPGHEAFTQMRARGAEVTDVVVLVVAADDGVKPQTVEAIDHAKAANVPIVVAVNKVDKPGAEPDRVRQELIKYELVAEEWGGKTIMQNVSAKTGEGIDALMELLALESDLLELKANPNKTARGTVIESELSRGQGPVAWVLIQSGTLRAGDIFLAGTAWGRVRAIQNARGGNLDEAGPSTPVLLVGFDSLPEAGDRFVVVKDERTAREIAEQRRHRLRLKADTPSRPLTLEDLQQRLVSGEQNELNVVLKADAQGSADALKSELAKLGNAEVRVNVVHAAVGGINESDVLLASASKAVIIGFHVTANSRVKSLAEQEGIDIRTYRIIYEVTDDLKKALEGMLAPDTKEVVTGHAEIRQVFRSSAIGNIAGCYVLDGEINRGSKVRVLRNDIVVHESAIGTLKRAKDDARVVASGFECGIKVDNFEDVKAGDILETFRLEQVAKKLV